MTLLVIAGMMLPGCAQLHGRTDHWPGDLPQAAATITVFFVDGMDHTRFQELLERGRLPNIARRFVDGGVGVDHAVASLPPITYANAVSIITGRFPGHHGILGNRWFDPAELTLRDYGSAATYRRVNDDFTCPTLYDLLDDTLTVNVQGHTRRGVGVTFDNWARSGIDWFLGDYSDVDARVATCFADVARAARRAGRWPAVYFNYFPGVDEVGHRFGAESAEYETALVVADRAIGEIIAQVERAAAAHRRYYVLLTDHGHVPTNPAHYCDLAAELRDGFGLHVQEDACKQHTRAARQACLDGADAVLVNGAFRRIALHLRGRSSWQEPPPPEIVERLLGSVGADSLSPRLTDVPGVLCACLPAGADAVLVRARSGWARIERRSDRGVTEYRMIAPGDGPDPLGYRQDAALAAFVNAGWHTSREWLTATAHHAFPDFVPQVVELFDSPRAGDIVVFAESDWTFDANWRGGHGSCLARDMRVPLYFAGPDLPAGERIDCARLVDVMPTVLDMLDRYGRLANVPEIDGVSLLADLRGAGRGD